jgi:hypothetical protein
MNPKTNTNQLVDDAYVMSRLNCSDRFARRLRDERRVPIVKYGRRVLFTVEGIEEYVRQNTINVVGR